MKRGIIPLAVVVTAMIAWWVYVSATSFLSDVFGDFRQVLVALMAASVMGLVGFRLTMGKGSLAQAGQVEKIAVWAALLMSVASSVTTSLGLLLVLSPNPQSGALLTVGLSILLGLGIQLSMLMYALRIGDRLQSLQSVRRSEDPQDDDHYDDDEPGVSLRSVLILLSILILALIGVVMFFGNTLSDILLAGLEGVVSNAEEAGHGAVVIGGILSVGALVSLVVLGYLPRPAAIGGLVFSLGIYCALLLFSSGFGYLSYFLSSQSNEVLAIDRDSEIESRTPALVRMIQAGTREDVNNAFFEARDGADYHRLSQRIDTLQKLFIDNEERLRAQIEADKVRAQDLVNQKLALQSTLEDAKTQIKNAEQAVVLARSRVARAVESRDRGMQTLSVDLAKAEQEAIDAAAGRDSSGIALCRSRCNRAKARARRVRADIKALDDTVSTAQSQKAAAEAVVADAKRALEATSQTSDVVAEAPRPIVIQDRSSFTIPRTEYNASPSVEGLKRIARTCSKAKDFLISIDVSIPDDVNCNVSRVEAALLDYQNSLAAQEKMVLACQRTKDELALEAAAVDSKPDLSLTEIPVHLRARLAWVGRCMTAASTGTDNMNNAAVLVGRLKSEYTTPGFDVRRVLSALQDGNRYAIFAALMAVVVDTAILFAGFAANSFKGRNLGDDDDLISAPQIAERIKNALETAAPGAPHLAAQELSKAWTPRTHGDTQKSPYSHELRFNTYGSDHSRAFQLIMDAAGTYFARYDDDGSEGYWQLHKNFVALIMDTATNPAKESGSSIIGSEGFGQVDAGNNVLRRGLRTLPKIADFKNS